MAQWKISGRQAACTICSHEFEDGERHHSMVSFAEETVLRGDFCQSCWDQGASEFDLQAASEAENSADPREECEAGMASDGDAGEPELAADGPANGPAKADESTGDSAGAAPVGEDAPPIESNDATPGKPHRFWWTTTHQAKPQKTLQMDMDALQRLFLELTDRKEINLRELRYVLCLLLMRKKRVKLERILRDDSGESFIVRRPKLEERYTVEVFDFTPERMAEVREHLQAIFDGVDEDESLAQAAAGEEPDESQEELAEPVPE